MVALLKKVVASLLFIVCSFFSVSAQYYHGIQGSAYFGSLSVHENPSTILSSFHKWDITLLGVQGKVNTNTLLIRDYSLLSNPRNSKYIIDSGSYKRYIDAVVSTNILNTRIAIGRKAAIAFGLNVKTYVNGASGQYRFLDTIHSMRDFMRLNIGEEPLRGEVRASSWAEIYGTYAQTIINTSKIRLNGGITAKVNTGLAGAFANAGGVGVGRGAGETYAFVDGNMQFGYSANLDGRQRGSNLQWQLRDLVSRAMPGFSFDLGAEMLIKPEAISFYGEDDYYDYNWKLSAALLDIGFTRYAMSRNSRSINVIQPVIDSVVEQKLQNVGSVDEFVDSLSTLVATQTIRGDFYIINPMRVQLSADRYIGNYFYVHAALTIDVARHLFKENYRISSRDLLVVTPRWEKRNVGFSLPIIVNERGNVWVGGSMRVGPLLLGVHNWANLFSKNKMSRGGGYIAITLRSPGTTSKRYDRRLDCPPL